MSGIQQRTKIHFIAALLAHAIIADVDFNSHKGVWITSDKLASVLNMHYCIHPSLHFSGNELCTTTSNNYIPILNRLGLGTINSENFELNTSHAWPKWWRKEFEWSQPKEREIGTNTKGLFLLSILYSIICIYFNLFVNVRKAHLFYYTFYILHDFRMRGPGSGWSVHSDPAYLYKHTPSMAYLLSFLL